MKRAKVVVLGALAGLAAGLLLQLTLGARVSRAPEAPAPKRPKPGVAESERARAESAARVEELREKIAAAEQACAELRAKRAAAPAAPAPLTRREKAVRVGRILTRVALAEGQPPSAELQNQLGEVLALCQELGLNIADPSVTFDDAEILAGLFGGILAEAGLDVEEDARRSWERFLAERLGELRKDGFALRAQAATGEVMVDFYERFGPALLAKNPDLVRKLSAFGSTSTVSFSALTRAQAVEVVMEGVRKSAGLGKESADLLRPVSERWLASYGERIEAARARNPKLPECFTAGQVPPGVEPPQVLELTTELLRLKSSLVTLQAGAVEEMAAALPPDAAQRLKKFNTLYFFSPFKSE